MEGASESEKRIAGFQVFLCFCPKSISITIMTVYYPVCHPSLHFLFLMHSLSGSH